MKMKTIFQKIASCRMGRYHRYSSYCCAGPRRYGSRGFVLIAALSMLVLLMALVVAFLVATTTEQSASASYRATASTRQMADTAVSLVQGQIRMATSRGQNLAWVSQPGMVRTYDSNGNMAAAYKLYSAPAMISTTPLSLPGGKSTDEPPATWGTDTAAWTDLNAPVELTGSQSGQKIFPILDPGATAEGFSITGAPGSTTYQPAPMPVRWLYVLADGTLAAPVGSGTSVTVPGETNANPITGRIAFWTDDDSCKVNINTASTGTFWDIPRAYSFLTGTTGLPVAGDLNVEQGYGYFQPVQKEFQRYPGHPAMTDLRAVFGSTLTADQIYALVPRVVGGGSTQGSVHVSTEAVLTGYPKDDRLYASVDEMLFKPDRTAAPVLTRAQVERAKFFLTAHSRAPETNLFNLPRLACWPIHTDLASNASSPYTTAFDRLIAFCASTGTGTGSAGNLVPYYFQRQNALSSTGDVSLARNKQLLGYLQYLTSQAVPGFAGGGATFVSKYGTDRDQILTEIFDYIRCVNLYDTTLTGAGQYAFTRDAKGCVAPSVRGTAPNINAGFGRTYTLSEMGLGFICNADGNYAPSNIPEKAPYPTPNTFVALNKGGNRVLGGTALLPNEKYVQAILVPEYFSVMYGFIALTPNFKMRVSGLSSFKLNGKRLFPDDADSTLPFATNYPTIFPYSGGTKYGASPGWRYFALGTRSNTRARAIPTRGTLPADNSIPATDDAYPFVGTPVKITDTGGTMDFEGGTLTVEMLDPSENVVQSMSIKFPPTTFPTPKIVTSGTISPNAGTNATGQETWWGFNKLGVLSDGYNPGKGGLSATTMGRFAFLNQTPGTMNNAVPSSDVYYSGVLFRPGFDVVRTVMPRHGDFRIIAGKAVVPEADFQPHRYYYDTTRMIASNLTNSSSSLYDPGYDMGGKYISTLTYPSGKIPDIASNASAAETPEATGDYDDPSPDIFPGPFVNKPNEGCSVTPTLTKSIPYYAPTNNNTILGKGVDELPDGGSFFSPNRMMPSPGMFGSLPTGVLAGKPWRTLLFRPQSGHPGALSPVDHLLLDLFWMPVVDPYAISDRFSTAGKINMNYQILPFTYLKRSTGLRALFKSEKVTAMPNNQISVYKTSSGTKTALRRDIDADQTLTQFQSRFDTGDVFKSSSEICDLHIVPTGQTVAGMPAFWTGNILTGDNVREMIYTNLYPRLTTRSNTYTVHFKVQALKKARTSSAGTWTEGRDIVQSEYRGSTTIERFIDANNAAIPDYAADPDSISTLDSLDTFYRWRVIANHQFSP